MKNNLTFVAAFALLFALGGSGAHGSTAKGGHGVKPYEGGEGVRPEMNLFGTRGQIIGGAHTNGLFLINGKGNGFAKGGTTGTRGIVGNQGSCP